MAIQTLKNKKGEVIGYRGYSHRGGMEFKIGDILFDENYKLPKTHKDYDKYKKKADKNDQNIMEFVPFKLRGKRTCKTLTDCKKAAERFGLYVS